MKKLVIGILGMFIALSARAKVTTEVVEYQLAGTTLEGFLAYDPDVKEKRPVILLVHEWMGLGDYEKVRAQQFADKGYVVFALDIYGKGVRPKDPQEAAKEAAKYRDDRKLMRERAQAGYDFIKTKDFVEPTKMVSMGYCFGGTVALEMARAGLDLVGTVSFHGGLESPTPQDAMNIKSKLLILHGAIDPHTMNEVPGFMKEMNDAKVDYQFISYSNTVHSFTNPAAGNDPTTGAAYNALSDKRAHQAFFTFLEEVAPLK